MTYISPISIIPSKPPRILLLENLTTQTHLLTQLFTHLASANPPANSQPSTSTEPNPIHQIYTSLQSATDELARVVEAVQGHQLAFRGLERRKAEVMALERLVRGLVRDLERGRKELERVVCEAREIQSSILKSKAREYENWRTPNGGPPFSQDDGIGRVLMELATNRTVTRSIVVGSRAISRSYFLGSGIFTLGPRREGQHRTLAE